MPKVKIKEYRVRNTLVNDVKHYYIEVRGLWGLMWADINVSAPTPDKSAIESMIIVLESCHVCTIDRWYIDN